MSDSLDDAWAAAEAAMSEKWSWGHLQLQVDDDGSNPEWEALVGCPATGEIASELAATPAAALRALAKAIG